jgi:hypothetical protein
MIINLRALKLDKLFNPIIAGKHQICFYKMISDKFRCYYIYRDGVVKDILPIDGNPKNRTEAIMLALKFYPNATLKIL